MPEVPGAPYEPFSQVQPTERPIPLPEPRISGAAFGENIANAARTFGGDVERVGDELGQRALALRQLQVDGAIRDINTAAYQEVAPKQAAFLAAQENGAGTDQLHAHLADIDQTRAKYAAQAAQYGIYGQNKFGEDFASMQKSLTIEASAHSASQTKEALKTSAQTALDSAADRVGNSTNPAAFDTELPNLNKPISDLAGYNGWDQNVTDRKLALEKSRLALAQVQGLSRIGNYTAAKQFYDSHRDLILSDEERDKALKSVQDVENTGAARDIGRAVAGGYPAYWTSREMTAVNGVDDHLLAVVKQAAINHPELNMTVGGQGGVRSPAQQAALVREGRSMTYASDHLTGRAIDIVPRTPDGRPDYQNTKDQAAIATAMREAADQLGIPLKPQISWDPNHFGLAKDFNTATAPKVPEESQASKIARGVRYAQNQYGDHNTQIGDYVTAHVKQNDDTQKSSDREEQFRDRQTLTSAVFGLGAAGQKGATNLDEMFANGGRAAQDAWARADPTVQASMLDKMSKIAKGENIQWTPQGLNRYRSLLYMQDHDTNSFIENNMIAEPGIPTRYIVDLMKRQERALVGGEVDPNIGPVAQYINNHYDQELSPLTADQRKQYYGAVKSGVESFVDKWGHPPRTKEDYEMIHDFAKTTTQDPDTTRLGRIFGFGTRNIWDSMPDRTLQEYKRRFPGESDENLLMRYQRDTAANQFNELFSKYGKKGIGGA